MILGTQGSSSSDRVVLSFLSDLARAAAADTGAADAAVIIEDTYLGFWAAGAAEAADGMNPLTLASLGTALNQARSDPGTPCSLALDDGRTGRLVIFADAPDAVMALVLFGLPEQTAMLPGDQLTHQVRAGLFRSLIVSGMGRAMLTQDGERAPREETGPSGSFADLIARCSSLAARLVGAESAGIMLYDAREDRMAIAKPAFGIDDESLLKQYCVSLASPANSVKVFRTGVPYISQDVLSDPRTPRSVVKSLRMFNVHKLLVVPLLGSNGPIGVINVADKKDGEFSEGDVRIVQSMGNVFGHLIEERLTQQTLAHDKALLTDQLSDTSRQLESLRFHVSLTDALLSCMVSDQSGLERMVSRLSTLLNRELCVYDLSGNVVALEPQTNANQASTLHPQTLIGIGESERQTLLLNHSGAAHPDLQPLSDGDPPADPDLSPDAVLLEPIRAGHRALGYLAISGFDGRVSREERTAIRRACTYLAAEIMRGLAEQGSEEKRGSALVDAAIHGRASEEEVRDVSRSLGRGLVAPYCVVVARRPTAGDGAAGATGAGSSLQMLRSALDAALGRSWLMSVRETECVVVCSLKAVLGPAAGEGPATLRARLAAALPETGASEFLSVGIGPACETTDKIAASHNEARVAAVVSPGTGGHTVVCAEGLGVYRLLAQVGDKQVLLQFARRALGPLLDDEQVRSSRYVETLECYLDCDGHLKQASGRLYVHPNTLRYRLSRIQELLGCDVGNSADRLNLAVALKALRLARMLAADAVDAE